MIGALVLLWPLSIAATSFFAIQAVREIATSINARERGVQIAFVLIVAGIPIFVFLFTVTSLAQTSPTMQFNTGSSQAMSAWSTWASWFPTLLRGSLLQSLGMVICLIVAFVVRARMSIKCLFIASLVASLTAIVLLMHAAPPA